MTCLHPDPQFVGSEDEPTEDGGRELVEEWAVCLSCCAPIKRAPGGPWESRTYG